LLVLQRFSNTVNTPPSRVRQIRNWISIYPLLEVETSMIEGDFSSRNPIAKVSVIMKRNAGAKELLEKLQEERKNETVHFYNLITFSSQIGY
jgi:hypothetical protein